MATGAKVYEFDVAVDSDRAATSGLGGEAIPRRDEWWPEHLLLAAFVRCTLASLSVHAERAELRATGSGRANGTVGRRDEDGLYAFVDIESSFDVELSPAPDRQGLERLIASAERGCFVGNSLTAKPRYRWTVNGEEVS